MIKYGRNIMYKYAIWTTIVKVYIKGLSSKFLFFHDKDLSVNVIKCLWSYDKTLMISLSLFIWAYWFITTCITMKILPLNAISKGSHQKKTGKKVHNSCELWGGGQQILVCEPQKSAFF